MKPFFRRQQESRGEVPTTFVHTLSAKVRRQLVMAWRDIARFQGATDVLRSMCDALGVYRLANIPRIENSFNPLNNTNDINELVYYFENEKDDEKALSVIELVCVVNIYNDRLIHKINETLRNERVGYKFERLSTSGVLMPIDDEVFTGECIEECLSVLSVAGYTDSLSHYLDAYEELRMGCFSDALTDLRQSIESLLKTKFSKLGIPYDKDKCTYSRLLEIAQKHCCSRFKFYEFKDAIQIVGSASNPLTHGHAEGETPNIDAIYVRYMINHTAANLLFLAQVPMKP